MRPDRLGGEREAVPARGPVTVPDRRAYPVGSPEYAADYDEVKSLGAVDSTTRTADQTHAAAFWNTNPAANYNALARRFVDQFSLDVSDSARLFAMLDLSAADAIINTWNDKYYYNFWRPITAIQNDDGNPATVADPTWTPLFNPALPVATAGIGPALITPPYPDHVSGATAYASASMHAFASFFGADAMGMPFYLTSSRFPTDPALPRAALFHAVLGCDERDPRSGSGPESTSAMRTCRRRNSVPRSSTTSTSTSSRPSRDRAVGRPSGRSTVLRQA